MFGLHYQYNWVVWKTLAWRFRSPDLNGSLITTGWWLSMVLVVYAPFIGATTGGRDQQKYAYKLCVHLQSEMLFEPNSHWITAVWRRRMLVLIQGGDECLVSPEYPGKPGPTDITTKIPKGTQTLTRKVWLRETRNHHR